MDRKAIVLMAAFTLLILWIGPGNSEAEVFTKIYWTDWGTGSIQRANLNGTNIEDIATGFAGVRGITVDNSNDKIYWIDNRTGSIQCGNLDGTDIEDIITDLDNPSGLPWMCRVGRSIGQTLARIESSAAILTALA